MRQGDLVSVSLAGDCDKPRPGLVIQSDCFSEHDSVTVLPLTSGLREAPLLRVTVDPTPANDLRAVSQVMIDKTSTLTRGKVQPAFGRLDADVLLQIKRMLAVFQGIVK